MTILNGVFKTYDLTDSFFNHCINELGVGVHLVPVSLSVVRRTTRDNIVDIRFCYNHRDPLPLPRFIYNRLVKNFPISYSACFLDIAVRGNGGIQLKEIVFEGAKYKIKPPPVSTATTKRARRDEMMAELKTGLRAERDKINNDITLNCYQKHDKHKELTKLYANLRQQKLEENKVMKIEKPRVMTSKEKSALNREIVKKLRAELYAERDKINNNSSLSSNQKTLKQQELTRLYRDKIEEAKIK